MIDDSLASAVVEYARGRGVEASVDADLGSRTTYRVGGRARVLIETRSAAAVAGLGSVIGDDVPVVVLGNGSNVLVSDRGFDGVVVLVSSGDGHASEGIGFEASPGDSMCEVVADAHVRLPVLARRVVSAGWCGLEWMVGVPGSVGGAVRMNAGGHGSDVASSLVSVELVNIRTGSQRTVRRDDLGLRFRGSALHDSLAVVSARFLVAQRHDHDCDAELSAIVAWRREHQPGGQNAGSVFVNPGSHDRSAGALIDSLGLRGQRIGTAEVSRKHANFIQADSGGRADDVVSLMRLVQDRVKESTGVVMRSEVRLLGFPEDVSTSFVDRQRDDDAVIVAERKLSALL